MTRTACHQGRSRPCLFGVLLVGLLPAVASADTVLFRNECNAPLIVQATHVYRGVLKRDQYLLRPGESTPKMTLDCDKLLTIQDGKTGRLLFRNALKANKTPRAYSITVDRTTGRIGLLPRRVMTSTTERTPGR
jgi:hypothetical protein